MPNDGIERQSKSKIVALGVASSHRVQDIRNHREEIEGREGSRNGRGGRGRGGEEGANRCPHPHRISFVSVLLGLSQHQLTWP